MSNIKIVIPSFHHSLPPRLLQGDGISPAIGKACLGVLLPQSALAHEAEVAAIMSLTGGNQQAVIDAIEKYGVERVRMTAELAGRLELSDDDFYRTRAMYYLGVSNYE